MSSNRYTDQLFILKTDKKNDPQTLRQDEQWLFCKYNHEKDAFEETGTLHLKDYFADELCYTGDHFVLCTDFYSRLKYAAAGLYDDRKLLKAIKKIFPFVNKLDIPAKRYTTEYYLPYWLDKYNIDLVDFLLNDKYIIISAPDWKSTPIDMLSNLGLLNWDNIKYYCIGLGEEEYEENN